jgi:elongation factor P hydroxylase
VDDSRHLAIIEQTFAALFTDAYQTRLIGGADEPLYRAATAAQPYHQLYYRDDYPASALHEIAHWCIAGTARRRCDDFGYWYQAGERSAELQRRFESVEVAPQALEWLFSRACGRGFQLSVDNFAVDNRPPAPFAEAVLARLQGWLASGALPTRAAQFAAALNRAATNSDPALLFSPASYSLSALLADVERGAP